MKIIRYAVPLVVALLTTGMSTAADARAKAVERYKTVVDDQQFKVIRYENGSAKVVQTGVFGGAPSFNLRERMRRAVTQATSCGFADDFWIDVQLVGTLLCDASEQGASS